MNFSELMKAIRPFFSKHDYEDVYTESNKRFLGNIYLLCGGVLLLYISSFIFIESYIAAEVTLCCLVSYIVGYVFVRKNKILESIYIFFISSILSITACAAMLGERASIQYLYLLIFSLILILFKANNLKHITIIVIFAFTCFVFLECFGYQFMLHSMLSEFHYKVISFVFKFSTFVLSVIFMYMALFDRMMADDAINTSRVLAEEALKTKSEFLSSMSHEIRTPMNGIIGFTELMLQDESNIDKVEKLELVKYSATNLLKIINEILDFSKIEAGKMHFENAAFNVGEQIQDFVKLQEITHFQNNVKFILELSPEIPAFVTGDKFRLNQIVLNLVSNAIKFTVQGFIKIAVLSKYVDERNTIIEIQVQDSGIGIAPSKLNAIFESFTQEMQSTTRQYGGTGLGLSITKQMVELQGGSISAISTQGVGSTFTITLPFKISTYEEIFNIPKKFQPTTKSYKRLKGHTILLVEDNILNQKLASHIFRKWDIDFKIANNGMRAVKMLEKESFDCVLMDLHMPVMNGIDATKIIRNVNSDVLNHQVPIVALTADAFEETKSLTKEAGMNYFLSKPFSQDSLLEILLSAVGQKKGDKIKVKNVSVPEIAQANTELINLKVLNDLIGDDTDTLIELLAEYIANAPIDYNDLKIALSGTDLLTIKSAAHKIKSTFKTFGINQLAETAKEIEFGAKDNMSFERLNELGAIIEVDFLATIAEAKTKLEVVKASKS